MDSVKNDRENTSLNDYRFLKIRELVTRLKTLNQLERVEYFKKISNNDLDIIEEILLNATRGNIPLTAKAFKILRGTRKYIYNLISNKVSKKNKKQILYSLKGLQIISLILPLVSNLLI